MTFDTVVGFEFWVDILLALVAVVGVLYWLPILFAKALYGVSRWGR